MERSFCSVSRKRKRKRKRNGRTIPFRHNKALPQTSRQRSIASSSAKPTRLSAWSSPVVIFTRQKQAFSTSFTLTRRQRGPQRGRQSPARGSPEARRNKRNGLAVVIPLRNKRNGKKRKLFFDSYCMYVKGNWWVECSLVPRLSLLRAHN